MDMKFEAVKIIAADGLNIIAGQAHFIKTVEDIYEVIVSSVPQAKFGLAFCEASGPCLIRVEGNDESLKDVAVKNAQAVACGHTFFLVLKDAYPVNVLPQLRNVQEVCSIFCATANPVEIIVAQTASGRGVMGVIDGSSPQGVEGPHDKERRSAFLRTLGYKR